MKNKTKHTPGPWVIEHNLRFGIKIKSVKGELVARPAGNNDMPNGANTVLIAAAPELLTALEAVVLAGTALQMGYRDGATMGQISAAVDNARAVIAKAKRK